MATTAPVAGATAAAKCKLFAFPTSVSETLLTAAPVPAQRRRFSVSASRVVQHPPDLIRWVRRKGGTVHPSLALADHLPFGIGVSAADVIPAGTDLIVLPSHLPLRFHRPTDPGSGDGGAVSPLAALSKRVPEELWAMKLGLRLLRERAMVGSFWRPYISALPETFSVPIFFSADAIRSLQYAPLVHQVNKRCRFLLEFEKEARAVLSSTASSEDDHPFGGQDVTASSLGWAMSAVSSRAFRLAEVPMMLPLIDMCNHSFDPTAQIVQEGDVDSPNMSIKVVAEREIQRNGPVTLNYGCLSNDFFLLDYGFVVPSNPYDRVELKYDEALLEAAFASASGTSSPSLSSPAPWQQEILSQLKLRGNDADLKVCLGGPRVVDGRLVAALRVLLSTDSEAARGQHLLNNLTAAPGELPLPLGPSVEAAALRTLISLCTIVLAHFPTKIAQDESALKAVPLTGFVDLAINFRVEKKHLIVDVMRKLTRMLRLLPTQTESCAVE